MTDLKQQRDLAASFPGNLPPGWNQRLASEKDKPYFRDLVRFLKNERLAENVVYPDSSQVLRALQLLDFEKVRVVILGQDPYHGEGQAMGLSFAVPNSLQPKPPSLKNIFKEIASDLNVSLDPTKSELRSWVNEGVLLLNTVLTVRAHEAFSHRDKGWEVFTDKIISELGAREEPLAFILWGAAAQKKKVLLADRGHLIIESAHPSPLSASRGFLGSRPFSRVNVWLQARDLAPINWAQTA